MRGEQRGRELGLRHRLRTASRRPGNVNASVKVGSKLQSVVIPRATDRRNRATRPAVNRAGARAAGSSPRSPAGGTSGSPPLLGA